MKDMTTRQSMPHRKNLEELVDERTAELKMVIEKLQQEIAGYKRMENKLLEREKHFQGLIETMTEGVIFIAPDGQIVQANPAAERILGLKRSEIESRNYISPEWEILREDGTPMPPEEMAGPRAMKGDRERCLKAGMNDYITKPIKRERVFEILEKWVFNKEVH